MIFTKKWMLRCTNPDCGFHTERDGGEPDVVCQVCGGSVVVNEQINYYKTVFTE